MSSQMTVRGALESRSESESETRSGSGVGRSAPMAFAVRSTTSRVSMVPGTGR